MVNTVKKIGLITCILMCVGNIIGSGIFGSLPTEINEIGSNVILAFVLAALFQTAVMVPVMYSSSIIPASGGFYVMSAKLIHPWLGVYYFVAALIEPVWVALYGVLFSDYFCQLLPSLSDRKVVVTIVLLLIFGILAYFGNYVFASINTIAVFALVCVIGMYIFYGISGISAEGINLRFALADGIKFNSFAVAVNVFSTCLAGSSSLVQISDDIKNPRRNIPLAIVLSTVSVALIYILMSIATLKYIGNAKIETLAEVARTFMPSSMVVVFIICGPIIAVITSLTPHIMSIWSRLYVMAQDKLLPQVFTKTNKHGVSVWCLAYVMLFSIICVMTGSSFDILIMVASGLVALISIPYSFFPFAIKKRYPNAAEHAELSLSYKLVVVVSVFACVSSTYLGWVTLVELKREIWGLLLLYVIAILIYLAIRTKYLRKNGVDLMKELREPLKAWEEHEEKCRQLDLNKK